MRNRLGIAVMAVALMVACSATKQEEKKAEAPQPKGPPPAEYKVRFETTKGPFVIEVKREWAPRGADHFYELVSEGFYNGVRFHRVIRGFVAQFGINPNPKTNALWSTTYIPDESPGAGEAVEEQEGDDHVCGAGGEYAGDAGVFEFAGQPGFGQVGVSAVWARGGGDGCGGEDLLLVWRVAAAGVGA
ncbi:MAG: peptidylprolyl isomerase [Bryobacterales bacterium]|nr:peptidylprolyl isomerase [Bryobacterales bacterium]